MSWPRRHATALLAAAALAALALPRPAAATTSVGAGADVLLDPSGGEFQLTLGGDTRLGHHLSLGGRVGLLVLTGPTHLGVPLDVSLRARFSRIYLEGMLGPWLVFGSGDTIRFHGAVGFGLLLRGMTVGLEVGWLDPRTMVGLRLTVPI